MQTRLVVATVKEAIEREIATGSLRLVRWVYPESFGAHKLIRIPRGGLSFWSAKMQARMANRTPMDVTEKHIGITSKSDLLVFVSEVTAYAAWSGNGKRAAGWMESHPPRHIRERAAVAEAVKKGAEMIPDYHRLTFPQIVSKGPIGLLEWSGGAEMEELRGRVRMCEKSDLYPTYRLAEEHPKYMDAAAYLYVPDEGTYGWERAATLKNVVGMVV